MRTAVCTEEDVRQCLLGKGDNLNCMFLYTLVHELYDHENNVIKPF